MHPEDFKEVEKGGVFKKYLSEDWSFMQRWVDLNPKKNKIWCDTGIFLKHIGKWSYTLWDIEVKTSPAQSKVKAPVPESVNPEDLNLPPPGFDLKEEIEKGNIEEPT